MEFSIKKSLMENFIFYAVALMTISSYLYHKQLFASVSQITYPKKILQSYRKKYAMKSFITLKLQDVSL